MGRIMKITIVTTLLGLAMVAIPALAPAGQPEARLGALEPERATPVELAPLLADPREAAELSVMLPSGFTIFEAIAQDPFRS